MASKYIINGTTVTPALEDNRGSKIRPIRIKAPAHEVPVENTLIYRFSPTGTSGNIDPVNGTTSGVTVISSFKSHWDEASIGSAQLMILTAKRKDGTTAAIVDQLITVSINSVEVGRIYVDGTNEKFGLFMFVLPNDRTDSRFALTGASTTGDFIFAFTAADPSLEIYLEVAGQL